MSERLKLYIPVNLGETFGLLPKGEYLLGDGEGKTDPIILKHWLIKKLIEDGKAAVIKGVTETPVKKKSAPVMNRGGGASKSNTPDTSKEAESSNEGDGNTEAPEE